MIPKAALREYIERPRDSHVWMKNLRKDELLDAIHDLRPRPKLFHGLRTHQLVCFLLGVAYPQFAFWLDMGCVDGETEYLTPTGWKKIASYSDGLVGQYDPATRRVSFVKPRRYINAPQEEFLRFKSSRGVDQLLTPEHQMLVVARHVDTSHVKSTTAADWKHTPVCSLEEYQSDGYGPAAPWFYKVAASELVGKARVETTFEYDGPGLALTDAQIRVQVAVHADGYLANKTKAVIRIKKKRKQQRIRELLKAAGIEYVERSVAPGGFLTFRFTPPCMTKRYGDEWYRATLEQKKIICDEVPFWDGSHQKSDGVGFFTRSKGCADFIQFCFASTRRRSYLRGTIDYAVHAIGNGRTTNLAVLPKPQKVTIKGGRKYCFEVPSGFLVLRRNGNIFITGNSGKTLVALELLKYWRQCGMLRRGLVFLHSDKAYSTWRNQIKEYDIGFDNILMEGSFAEKWRAWEELQDGLLFVSYPGATSMLTKTLREKGKKNRWVPDDELIEQLLFDLDAVVLDESTKSANHDSLTFSVIERLMAPTLIHYALAGRPFGRDPTMLWAQHKLIDGGASLGRTLGLFREAFFISEENPFVPKRRRKYIKQWSFDKRKQKAFSRLIQHRSITYSEDECIDVPKWTRIVERVNFSKEAEEYYGRAVQTIIDVNKENKGGLRELENAFLRMRQMTSGFVGFIDDDSGDKVEVEFEENPKLERLLDLLDAMPRDRKGVVFYDFTYSGRKIFEAVKALGLNPTWVWSGNKNSSRDLERFKNDPAIDLLVINNRIGAYSLDGLQHVANYDFFYESPLSCIDREQAEKRLRRQGQKRRVFQYDVVVANSVDERILEFHQEGKDLHSSLLKNPAILTKGANKCVTAPKRIRR